MGRLGDASLVRRSGLLLIAVAVAATGCGGRDPLPRACLDGPRPVAAALRSAPGPVALRGGTRLSQCVELAFGQGELQEVGVIYMQVGTALAAQVSRSDAAALQLGYLVGATRRGAGRTNGVALEMMRRMEVVVGPEGPPAHRRAAYQRGLAAGARGG